MKGRATRDRLISAARGQFGEFGYEATSIEAILQAAEVKRGSLYHHFPTKQALFDAVLDEVVAELAEAAAASARSTSDPVAGLQAGCRAWLEHAQDPAIQRIALIDAPAAVGWSRWRELDEQYILVGVRRNLESIAGADRTPQADLGLLAHMVLASVSEAAIFIAGADDPAQALTTGQQAVDTLVRSIAEGLLPQ